MAVKSLLYYSTSLEAKGTPQPKKEKSQPKKEKTPQPRKERTPQPKKEKTPQPEKEKVQPQKPSKECESREVMPKSVEVKPTIENKKAGAGQGRAGYVFINVIICSRTSDLAPWTFFSPQLCQLTDIWLRGKNISLLGSRQLSNTPFLTRKLTEKFPSIGLLG